MEEILRQFGLRVKGFRQSRGISQEKLADLAGLDRSYVGGVERGERNISLINIHKLAAALNISTGTLLEDSFR